MKFLAFAAWAAIAAGALREGWKKWQQSSKVEPPRHDLANVPDGSVTHWHMRFDASGGVGQWNDLTAPSAAGLRKRLSELGVLTEHPGWDHDVRVEEAIMPAHEPVVVTARGRWELDPTRGARGYREAGRSLRLERMPTGRLTVSNDKRVLRRTPERASRPTD